MNESAELTCPKCEGQMRSYERNGIQIEQCRDCRGIFLDRGELERMIEAEGAYVPSTGAAPPPDPRYQSEGGHGRQSSHGGGYPGAKKRKGSFLSEMFD